MLDGQQRTISLAQFVNGDFPIEFNGRIAMFHNLTKEEQDQINDYDLMIYHCEGNDKEKLDWFKIINITGEKLFPLAKNILKLEKWKLIISSHGMKEEKQSLKIARCYAKKTIELSQVNKKQGPLRSPCFLGINITTSKGLFQVGCG